MAVQTGRDVMLKFLQKKFVSREDIEDLIETEMEADRAVGVSEELVDIKRKEKDGGPCPLCGKEWKRTDAENRFAKFHYFEPACNCFPHCPYCHRSLHREWFVGGGNPEKCTSCGMIYPPSLDARKGPSSERGKRRKKFCESCGCSGGHLFFCPSLGERRMARYCPECQAVLPMHMKSCGLRAARREP